MSDSLDLRGVPTAGCPSCGSELFKIVAAFDEDYEVCYYFLDAECWECGSLITAPTPLDLPSP
jgi:hypothetical protein